MLPDVAAQPRCDLGRRPGEALHAAHVEERLVDREPLDERGRVLEHPEHRLARLGVGGHPRPDDDRVRAEPPCLAAAHGGADAVGLRLVARREDDARPDDHRPAAEPRIVPLLDRRVEGVDVSVEDRCLGHANTCSHTRGGRPRQILGAGDRVAAGSRTASTLYATTGRWNPLSTNSPAGSTSTASSTSAWRRCATRIWPAVASSASPRREVRHRSDRRVVGAALEPHLAAGRVAERDAGAEVEVVATLPPDRRQLAHLFPERAPEPYCPQRGVGHLDRVVEEELDAVALDEPDRRVEPLDEPADRVVELAQHAHQLLGLDGVDEARPPAQIGEEHRDLAAVAAQDGLVTGGDDRVRELRREEPSESLQSLELLELRAHPLLERPVQIEQLGGLALDRVVVALDPEQRPDAGEKLFTVERLRDEVVRARLDRRPLLGPFARREHDHGQHGRLGLLAEPPADGETVGLRHHHVEQDEIRLRRPGELERGMSVGGRDDVVALRLQHRLEEAHVLGDVVDHEDPCGGVAHRPRRPQ